MRAFWNTYALSIFPDVNCFTEWAQALGKPGDLALAISTSGNSPNVVKAVETAREMGIRTVALTGGTVRPGGALGPLVDLLLNVPADSTPHIQETHIWVEHVVCELVEREMFGDSRAA